jgi:hypothetical protein
MRKGNTKRSFMAPQPAAQIAALDFAHQSEAFRRALAASEAAHRSRDIDAADAACKLAGEIADRLLGIPTTNPAQIAEKVNAFCFANHLSVDLANPADQRRVAESDHDGAKGLLAIYLDLASITSEAAWTGPLRWVEATEKQTGCFIRAAGDRLDFSDDENGKLAAMMQAWEGLPLEHRESVRVWVLANRRRAA